MRVLHVEAGRHLYGGAQQVVYLLRGLAARGVSNQLACPRGSAITGAAGPFADIHAMPMGGDLDLTLVIRLRRLIRRCRPDIVHLHSRAGADLFGGLAARLTGVPAVCSRRVDNPERRWLAALKYRLHDRVIAISDGIGQVLLASGLPPEKLRVVRSAIDCGLFEPPCERARVCTRLGAPVHSRLLGVVAQLIPRKGHRFLINALPTLIRDFPDLCMVFFGRGPEEAALRAQVVAARLDDRVLFAGFRDDLPEILPCLELLVHPALMEGLGVALLQAACAGVPVVASAVGGIPEAVRDGVNGLLVPPGDTAALAAAIKQLLADPALAARLGQNGQRLVREEFSVETMVDGNLAVYREMLG
jgi:glycosyltransferase involved in cell wall biosynthesis